MAAEDKEHALWCILIDIEQGCPVRSARYLKFMSPDTILRIQQ
jgi:hypothetical protein